MLAFLFLIFLFFLKAFITVANQMLLILKQQSRCLGFHYIILFSLILCIFEYLHNKPLKVLAVNFF